MRKLFKILFVFALFLGMVGVCGCFKAEKRNVYTITAEYEPESQTLSAEMTFNYINHTENEISELKFNLFGNAYREGAKYEPISTVYHAVAYYDGDSYGEMKIESVSGCKDWQVCGEDKNILSVTLENSVFPDEEAEITISFCVQLASVNHRLGVTEKMVNLGNFYPVLCAYEEGKGFLEGVYFSTGDPFYSECADYKVSFTVPLGYHVVASTSGMGGTYEGKTKYEYRLKNARDFALALGKDVKLLTDSVNGVKLQYLYYKDENTEESMKIAAEAIDYFSKTFGDYEYDCFTLVQTGFCYGGMEYPGMVLLSDNLSRENYLYTIVHEAAHQWWYAMVGNDETLHAWMDEGLAEYSTAMFFDSHPEYGKTAQQIVTRALTEYKAYYGIYQQIFGEVNTDMDRPLDSFVSEYEYMNLTYNKGVILFDTLKKGIGEKRFVDGLKSYFAEYKGKIATPENLMEHFRRTGVDVDGLFTSFVTGKAVI